MLPVPLPALPTPHHVARVPVHPLSLEALLDWIEQTIACERRGTVLYANAYAINLAQRCAGFRTALNEADVVFCDGYGVWLAAQLLGTPLPARFTPPDWIGRLLSLCEARQYRLFFLGARPGVGEQAAIRLRLRFPGLTISTQHGYFDPDSRENEQVLARIAAASPEILLVGMGMPRQELWMQANSAHHPARVVIAVGALFDYLAGRVRRGPRWLTDFGGEWLWRLGAEPRRLWRRYLLGNPAFLWLIFQQWLHERVR